MRSTPRKTLSGLSGRTRSAAFLLSVVAVAAADCLWMTRVAINILLRALRVRLHFVTAAGRDWNMENFYGNACPVVEIMDHIDACVCACAEIAGTDDLDCVGFFGDVADPAALAEAIRAGASVNHITGKSTSNCGLEGGEAAGKFLACSFGCRLRPAEHDPGMVVQPRGRADCLREISISTRWTRSASDEILWRLTRILVGTRGVSGRRRVNWAKTRKVAKKHSGGQ
jgi:hypothetical protein